MLSTLADYIVFPAHAGMNRSCASARGDLYRVPRTRGDEPSVMRWPDQLSVVFPAHAGMNQALIAAVSSVMVCSPHTRG